MTSILEVKKSVEPALLEDNDVMAVGLSPDWTTIIVYLRRADAPIRDRIPGRIGGYPVEIRVSGSVLPLVDRTTHIRPLAGGISAGHPLVTAGTIACMVRDRQTDNLGFLSNNHIFAAGSWEMEPNAAVGDNILQPGPLDGATPADAIGPLVRWIPWVDGPNITDAAIMWAEAPAESGLLGDAGHVGITGVAGVTSGIRVHKYGRTTGHTQGTVVDTDGTMDMEVGTDSQGGPVYVRFVDQLILDMPAGPGDSGSLLLDSQNRAVGLVFAGGDGYVFANKIRNTLALLDAEIVTEPSQPSSCGILIAALVAGIAVMVGYQVLRKKKR